MTAKPVSTGTGVGSWLAAAIDWVNASIARVAHPVVTQLVLRFGLAMPFWRSGILKWDGFLRLNDTAVYLFASEFQLHLPGGPYSFPAPTVVAFAAGSAEIVLPILLVFGFGTRVAATGLLVMTAVVQLTEPSGWPIHVTWAAMALGLMAGGPGAVSIDRLITQFRRNAF